MAGVTDEEAVDGGTAPESDAFGAGTRHRRHLYPSRPHRAFVRLSDHEYDLIAAAAARSGVRLASWIGRVATAAASESVTGEAKVATTAGASVGEAALQADIHAELIAARRAVDHIGVNLNQAVARFHALGEPPAHLELLAARVEAAVERLEQAATAARVPRR